MIPFTHTNINSGKFVATRSSQPCPICNDIKGKCRIVSDEFVLCMTFPEDAGIPGWRYLGETKGSYYAGKYVVTRFESESDRQQRQETARRLATARQKDKQERLSRLPAIEVRDRQWHTYLAQITLDAVDRDELYSRGLDDDQIARIGFKSLDRGYITPIYNPQGQILGAQLRQRGKVDGGRYRWHKPYGWDIHLPNGDVPLAYFLPFDTLPSTQPDRVVLTEGTGVKPALAANLLSCPAIGAAGGNFTASRQLLKAYLDQIGAVPGVTRIIIAPDAGDVSNAAVMRRLQKTFALVKALGYGLDVLWWGQFTKQDDDIDELEDTVEIAYLAPDEFLQLGRTQQQWTHSIGALLAKLSPQPQPSPGFIRQIQAQPSNIPLAEYPQGKRLSTWVNASNHGLKHILDTSMTGTGKSFDAGKVEIDLFEARQVIYISDQHRNVTTPTLKGWQDLEARHGGLTCDTTGKVRRSKPGQEIALAANCGRAGAVAALRAKGVAGADGDAICQTCPVLNACRNSRGDGYGFKYERKEALAKSRLRAHPASLPDPSAYDYSNTVLIWDEADANFTTNTKLLISITDVDAVIVRLSTQAPELFQTLQTLLTELRNLLAGKQPKFGYDLQSLRQASPKVAVDASALKAALQPDLSCLDTIDEIDESEFVGLRGKQKHHLAELSRQLKRSTTLHSYTAEQRIDREVLKQWLPELLQILDRDDCGYAAIYRGTLKLTLIDTRLRSIASASKVNIFLSATWSRKEAARSIGCNPDEFFACRQRELADTVKPRIIQVKDLGRMGMQRGADQQQRLEAIIAHYKNIDPTTEVIDFKKFQADRAWWRDSRGLNDFADSRTLMVVGAPCRNLLDLLAEYATLMGKVMDSEDAEFKAFVDGKILADTHQCFGRKMGSRCQPGDLIVFVSDFDLDVPVQQVNAAEITPDAASKSERVQLGIKQAISWLTERGKKVTQQAIAKFLGMTREAISHYNKLIFLLLESLNSKKIRNLDLKGEDRETCEVLAKVVSGLVNSEEPLAEILAAIHEVFFDWIPPRLQRGVMAFLDLPARSQLLGWLAVVVLSPGSLIL